LNTGQGCVELLSVVVKKSVKTTSELSEWAVSGVLINGQECSLVLELGVFIEVPDFVGVDN